MKILLKMLTVFSLLLGIVLCTQNVQAETYSEGYFQYEIIDESITITSYFGKETDIVIPEKIALMKVTAIRGAIFKDKSANSVTIPEYVVTIDDELFTSMVRVSKVILKSKSISPMVPAGCILVEDYPVYVDPPVITTNEEIPTTTIEASITATQQEIGSSPNNSFNPKHLDLSTNQIILIVIASTILGTAIVAGIGIFLGKRR